jgi:hypothetical protein
VAPCGAPALGPPPASSCLQNIRLIVLHSLTALSCFF